MEADITIHNKGKMDVSLIMAKSEQYSGYLDMNQYTKSTNSVLEAQDKAGWKIERYAEDGYTGYISSIKGMPVDGDLSPIGILPENGGIRREGDKYIIEIDLFHIETVSELDELSSRLQTISNTDGSMKIRIRFPDIPLLTNATFISEDGRTHEWDLLDPSIAGKLYVEYQDAPLWKSLAVGGCIAVVLAIAVYFVIQIKRARS